MTLICVIGKSKQKAINLDNRYVKSNLGRLDKKHSAMKSVLCYATLLDNIYLMEQNPLIIRQI